MTIRDTPYARECVPPAVVKFEDGTEARIERLFVKEQEQEEIRFSWWKDGRIMMRPLDLSGRDLLSLLQRAIVQGVLPMDFIAGLRKILEPSAELV